MTAEARDPKPDTPGRPTDESSRQQTERHQSTQTGSRELDRKSADKESSTRAPIPPGPK